MSVASRTPSRIGIITLRSTIGDRLELGFEIDAALLFGGRQGRLLRGQQGGGEDDDDGQPDSESLECLHGQRTFLKMATVGRLSTSPTIFSIFHMPLCSSAAISAVFV